MSSFASAFSGTVPALYDRILGPVLFEPYADDLAARLPRRDGIRVLEIACGTGIVTRHLAAALEGSGSALVATDLSEPMLAHARESVSAPWIEWGRADVADLPFADHSFDLAVCQFGFMFPLEKVRAFAEARRVLVDGGTLLANCWRSLDANPFARAIHDTVARLFPDDPPLFLETPYGYDDAARIRADMSAAGWEDVDIEVVDSERDCPSAALFAKGFASGSPLTHELLARGADPDAVADELTKALIPVGGAEPFTARLSAHVIGARP